MRILRLRLWMTPRWRDGRVKDLDCGKVVGYPAIPHWFLLPNWEAPPAFGGSLIQQRDGCG